jgi:hypothetical protein
MIRINLLGVPRKTRGKRAAAASVGGGDGASSTVILGVVFLGALAVLILIAQLWVDRAHAQLEKDLQKQIVENQRLADVRSQQEKSRNV